MDEPTPLRKAELEASEIAKLALPRRLRRGDTRKIFPPTMWRSPSRFVECCLQGRRFSKSQIIGGLKLKDRPGYE
jgi:hypothetical protein